jgi:acetolactate synthase I/II/III large subunit
MSEERAMLGYEAITDVLHRAGVAHVFGMVGGTNVPWLAHGEATGAFRFVRTRHEETAVNAAAGYSRSTGGVGVCTVTRGPGLANAVGGLVAARASRHAVLLIVAGSTPPSDPTQDFDQQALVTSLGIGCHHVDQGQDL